MVVAKRKGTHKCGLVFCPVHLLLCSIPSALLRAQCDNDSCDSDDDLGLGFPGGLEASSLGTSAATLSSRGHSGRGIDEDSLREFTTQELREATSGFSRILGEGGFGHVFHGRLALHPGSPPVDVAVKVQKTESQQGLKELQVRPAPLSPLTRTEACTQASVGQCRTPPTWNSACPLSSLH